MADLIRTNDNCIGCNRCVGACSCVGANISVVEDGRSRIIVDTTKCIACGACIDACEHHAREFEDDVEFIRDATGEFINRINGEYVIASSKSDLQLDMEPQLFLEEDEAASVLKPLSILHIPVKIGDSEAEMLFVKMSS